MDQEYASLLEQLEAARDAVHAEGATDEDRQLFRDLQQQVADRRVVARQARQALANPQVDTTANEQELTKLVEDHGMELLGQHAAGPEDPHAAVDLSRTTGGAQ